MSRSSGPIACMTLDLEEDWCIPGDESPNPTFDHVDDYIALIEQLDVPISVFVVGVTIENYPGIVERLRWELDAEFHLHSYQHDMTKSYEFETEIQRGVAAFESHFGEPPRGYRAPQGNIVQGEWAELERAGFEFSSSVFPSYRPGVYNNIRAPLTPYVPTEVDRLLEIPFAAVPGLRIPISQNYLKLLGRPYLSLLKHVPLPTPLVYDSHLQDFWRTEFHDHLPQPKRTLMTRNMDRSVDILTEFVSTLRRNGYTFEKVSDLYEPVAYAWT
ncbi:polysaccharide deacetylase family protein [Natronosalvus caseinilyticus]|uniref:polysaccharide deacetylase family protein n=1 Tax=Natronosalvus caseinilyticus TaxID=2953747 RepID=UPI0028B105D2|nr:polysaccharide deacetylase family protein [Natronosalvus caseinilyticus]